jgi:hypothetical protein
MERVIAHFYNRALERHGPQLDRLAVVKFHGGDRIGTTFEGGYSTTIKDDQPWLAEFVTPGSDWFWKPGISYDSGGAIVQRLLETVSRDGVLAATVPPRPDGALDSGATNMLAGVGQWMAIHAEGIYGSHAWVKPAEGLFRFTVGTNGCLYAYYLGLPGAGTALTIDSLATSSNLLAGPIGSVSLLGSAQTLTWSQTTTGLVVTCPTPMPSLPSGTAIGFKIGPSASIGSATPVNVIASPDTNGIKLFWYCPSSTATFNIKRATTHGGPYTTIATTVTNLFFNDAAVSAGTLYFYTVSAMDTAGGSVNSAETSAALAGAPSSQWLTEDVGAVGLAGSLGLAGNVFTVQGSGADIWYQADAFRYVFQALAGDCSITARVLNMQNTAGWAKAGVMIRETLDPASQYVINFISPANGAALQQRSGTGSSAAGLTTSSGLAAPYWVRLVRAGNTFTAYLSPDGITWAVSGATTIAMNASLYVGLAVCSVNNSSLCQAQFDNVSFSSTTAAVSSPLPPLIHRYSFNETSGTVAHDSVGGADGALHGSAAFDGQGRVTLNGTSGTFVSLPSGLLAGLSNVTIESWVTNAVSPDNVALFSFDDGLQDGVGTGYLRYVLHDHSNGRNFLELVGSGGSPLVSGAPGLGGQTVHLVCVYDPSAGIALIYTNGILEVAQAVATPLANVSTNAAALGRSPWNGDPWLNGAIDEFRIYSGQLQPADVAAAQVAGPGVLLTTNVSLGVSQGSGALILTWPVEASGFTLQSSPTLGAQSAWTTVTNAPLLLGGNNQVSVPVGSAAMFFRLSR